MSDEQPTQASGVRPTGKRQLAGVSTAQASTAQARRALAEGEESPRGNRVVSFLPEVVSEMKKVIWPTAKQMATYTLIVFVFLILMTALVAGVDFLVGLGVEKVLT